MEIRRYSNRLIFIIKFPVLTRAHINVGPGPRAPADTMSRHCVFVLYTVDVRFVLYIEPFKALLL